MRGRMTAAALAAVLVLAGCGGDDGGGGDDAASDTTAAPAEATTTTTAAPETFRILVSNDDGHEGVGEGLDTLVEALAHAGGRRGHRLDPTGRPERHQ